MAGVAALTFFAGGDFVAAALPFFAGVAWNWQQMEPWNERQVTTGWQAAEGSRPSQRAPQATGIKLLLN